MKKICCAVVSTVAAVVAASVEVPSVVTEKAAFWANMSETSVIADGDGNVVQWRDARETAAADATPTRPYLVPAWTNGFNATITAANAGKPPVKVRLGDVEAYRRDAIDFGGASGKYLRLYENGATKTINPVCHLFAVHYPSNWFGTCVGCCTATRDGVMCLYPTAANGVNYNYMYNMNGDKGLLWARVDLGEIGASALGAAVRIDGDLVDGFTYRPFKRFQSLEMEFLTARQVESSHQKFNTVNFTLGEGANAMAGGDYLSELIVFTGQLTAKDAAAVREYLLKKWNLPAWRAPVTGTNYYAKAIDYNAMPDDPAATAVHAGETRTYSVGTATDIEELRSFSGSGTIVKSGPGAIAIGPSGNVPFCGDFVWEGGFVYLRGGAPLPIAAHGNLLVDCYNQLASESDYPEKRDQHGKGGIRMAFADNAQYGPGEGIFRKQGVGPVRVKSVSNDVSRIQVTVGELTLGAPVSSPLEGAGEEIEVPNGDFEAKYLFASSGEGLNYNMHTVSASAYDNGWKAINGTSVRFMRADVGGWAADGNPTNDNSRWTAYNPPRGFLNSPNLMHTKMGNATAGTKVTLPRAGNYELHADVAIRYDFGVWGAEPYNVTPFVLDVYVGASSDSMNLVGSYYPTGAVFSRQKIAFRCETPGEKQVWIKSRKISANNQDQSAFFDNVRLFYTGSAVRDSWPIPNGDFETYVENPGLPYTSPCLSSVLTPAPGWTFTSTKDAGPLGLNPAIAVVNCNSKSADSFATNSTGRITSYTASLCSGSAVNADFGCGAQALMLLGTYGTASTTFTPPAGRWYLKCRFARHQDSLYSSYGCTRSGSHPIFAGQDTAAKLNAKVTISGVEQSLGQIQTAFPNSLPSARHLFTTPFDSDGATPVTLALQLASYNDVGALVDDLELVRADNNADADEEELVTDGSFERSGSWTSQSHPRGPSRYQYFGANVTSYSYWPDVYGYTMIDGYKYLKFQNECLARQTVTFKSAGVHRLRLQMRTRTDSTGYGNVRMNAWLVKENTTVTNVIANSVVGYMCNFAEYEYLFRVPEPGKYTFAIESFGVDSSSPDYEKNWKEVNLCVDTVSIRKVGWEIPETIDMSTKTRVDVSAGAILNLAFTGTNRVAAVRYKGVPVGETYVNAETCPEFVTGIGTLRVQDLGTIIQFR